MKRLIGFGAVVLLASLVAGCAQKQVLLVTQYPENSPQVSEMMRGIRAAFKEEKAQAQFTVFNMDTLRHPTETWRQEMGNAAVGRVRTIRPDLIFVAGDEAVRYFALRLAGTYEKFVFFGLKADPSDYMLAGSLRATGVREDLPVKETFGLMKQLVPNARGAAVLADRSAEGDAIVAKIERTGDLPIKVVAVRRADTVQQWMDAVHDLQDKADALCIASYSSVRAGPSEYDAVPPEALLKATAEANRLPDFSFWKEAVGPNGVMAAVVVPWYPEALLAGRIAKRVIYYRVNTLDIPIVACSDRETVINAERAAKLGIKLPAVLPVVTSAPAKPAEVKPSEPKAPESKPPEVVPK